jgi:hypothetical protein
MSTAAARMRADAAAESHKQTWKRSDVGTIALADAARKTAKEAITRTEESMCAPPIGVLEYAQLLIC